MTHDQYIRNIEYKIDSLFNEYNEIDMNINILAINSNHQMLTEGYTPDDIYYENIDYMVEATEKKKGIIGRIIDGIIKIVKTVVEKVKLFFTKNKPDPKAKVMVPKVLITKGNKIKKLNSMILKSLAIVGTIGTGAVVANKVAKGRDKGTEVKDDTSKNTPNDTPKPKEDTSDTAPSKNDEKSNGTTTQGSTNDQPKPTEVDTKKNEELEKLNKETEDALNDMKEDDEKLKRFMSLVDARVNAAGQQVLDKAKAEIEESRVSTLIEAIKHTTDSLTAVNNKIEKIKQKMNTDASIKDIYKTLWLCNGYTRDIADYVNWITKFLASSESKSARDIASKSSEMRELNKLKITTIRGTKEINNVAIPKLRNKIDEELKEFDKYDRGEDGDPDGWRIYKILKHMYDTAYDKSIPEKDRIKEIESQVDECWDLIEKYKFDKHYIDSVTRISNGLKGIVHYYK